MSSQSQVASTQVTKRQTKPAEVRIDELMNAAQTLFLAKGVEATTISEIIASVGVAKGTFYHYFESKQHIVEALKKRYIDFFIAALDTAVATCDAEDWVSLTGALRPSVSCLGKNSGLVGLGRVRNGFGTGSRQV